MHVTTTGWLPFTACLQGLTEGEKYCPTKRSLPMRNDRRSYETLSHILSFVSFFGVLGLFGLVACHTHKISKPMVSFLARHTGSHMGALVVLCLLPLVAIVVVMTIDNHRLARK